MYSCCRGICFLKPASTFSWLAKNTIALVTAAMVFFASQLKVDAGFKKQIPLQHEYMKTFLDYEADFGGANRVLVAVMAKDGNMFSDEYMTVLQQVTHDVINLEDTDDSH